ncbi:MAG: glutamine-hydrolyzing GMP synthase [Coxiellaceae bacterium]|nr:glutamine-hydrolyzing GMP synthase [Coxiellaceae bacterium]
MTVDLHNQRILILDFGSQYTQLIARRIRELGVFSEIVPCDCEASFIEQYAPDGIILSGGPESVIADETLVAPEIVFELGCPVLGICYGMQTMAKQLGGQVDVGHAKEFGYAKAELIAETDIFTDIEDEVLENGAKALDVWMSHGDHVSAVPKGFEVVAKTEQCPIVAMVDSKRQFFGLQFHPEVTHTQQGGRILARFIHDICGCGNEWTMDNIIESSVEALQRTVGDDHVLVALSGGVDSSVVAALLQRAIGDQLTCVFVDTGLLRLGEAEEVERLFKQHLGMNLITVDAKAEFYSVLAGKSDPEEKRKAIGETFIRIFEQESKKLAGDIKWLAQGTIYPDVIESAKAKSGKAHVIKSHHNVGGLPDDMPFELIEPLRELFKDEVRVMGQTLGLPTELVYRHPFPGPGLAVRMLGEVKPEYVETLQRADDIFISELRKADLYYETSQAFAVFLPVKSVGVKGDQRCYEYVIALRAVKTIDFMTAHWAELPHAFLAQVSNRIINEIGHVSRVVYDISGKPPSTIEWE